MYWYVEPCIGLHILFGVFVCWHVLSMSLFAGTPYLEATFFKLWESLWMPGTISRPTVLSIFLCLVPFCVVMHSTVSKANELEYPDSCILYACASKIILAVSGQDFNKAAFK